MPAAKRLRLSKFSTITEMAESTAAKAPAACTARADFQFAGEHVAGDDGAGQDDGQQAVGVLEQVEPQLAADQAVVVVEGGGEAAAHLLQLLRLAAVEGDRLGVFADPHQAEAEIRLAPQLEES
jgi:hypothetical protein